MYIMYLVCDGNGGGDAMCVLEVMLMVIMVVSVVKVADIQH